MKVGEVVFGLADPTVSVQGGTEAEYVIARYLELTGSHRHGKIVLCVA